jgi:hypothetical protein
MGWAQTRHDFAHDEILHEDVGGLASGGQALKMACHLGV